MSRESLSALSRHSLMPSCSCPPCWHLRIVTSWGNHPGMWCRAHSSLLRLIRLSPLKVSIPCVLHALCCEACRNQQSASLTWCWNLLPGGLPCRLTSPTWTWDSMWRAPPCGRNKDRLQAFCQVHSKGWDLLSLPSLRHRPCYFQSLKIPAAPLLNRDTSSVAVLEKLYWRVYLMIASSAYLCSFSVF